MQWRTLCPRRVYRLTKIWPPAFHKKNVLKAGSAFMYSWLYTQVRNRGPWDYKQISKEYEAFGNFHYVAVGIAAGFSEEVLLRAAGLAQTRAGTDKPEFGRWWGDAPFGDDPVDQYWIKKGIRYARFRNYEKVALFNGHNDLAGALLGVYRW